MQCRHMSNVEIQESFKKLTSPKKWEAVHIKKKKNAEKEYENLRLFYKILHLHTH